MPIDQGKIKQPIKAQNRIKQLRILKNKEKELEAFNASLAKALEAFFNGKLASAKANNVYTMQAINLFIKNYLSQLDEILDINLPLTEKLAIKLSVAQIVIAELAQISFTLSALKHKHIIPKHDHDGHQPATFHYNSNAFKDYIVNARVRLGRPKDILEEVQAAREHDREIKRKHDYKNPLDQLETITAIINEYKKSNKKSIKEDFLLNINRLKDELLYGKAHVDFHKELSSAIANLQTAEDNYYTKSLFSSCFSCFFKPEENSSLQPLITRITNIINADIKKDVAADDVPPRYRRMKH